MNAGNTEASDPATAEGDERMFLPRSAPDEPHRLRLSPSACADPWLAHARRAPGGATRSSSRRRIFRSTSSCWSPATAALCAARAGRLEGRLAGHVARRLPPRDDRRVDLGHLELDLGPRVHVVQGDQADAARAAGVTSDFAPQGFDLIIDDASHFGGSDRTVVATAVPQHLRPGGLYVIEDWGTGYLADWPTGARWRRA